MEVLLGELDRGPRPVRWLAGAGVLAVAGASAAGWLAAAPAGGPAPCEGFDRALDGVWDGSRRQAIEAAFAATGVGDAHETAIELSRTLDDHARTWVAVRIDACRATQRGEQSERVLDLRMRCLDRRRDPLGALIGAPDGGAIAKAVYAAHGLDPIADCSAAAVVAAPAPAADPRMVPWDRELAAARSDIALAKYPRAETVAATSRARPRPALGRRLHGRRSPRRQMSMSPRHDASRARRLCGRGARASR
jgi:hypothetical protein